MHQLQALKRERTHLKRLDELSKIFFILKLFEEFAATLKREKKPSMPTGGPES